MIFEAEILDFPREVGSANFKEDLQRSKIMRDLLVQHGATKTPSVQIHNSQRSSLEQSATDDAPGTSGERFCATTPWSAARPEHLVVCCSDGRWHAQIEEFVRAQVSTRADLYMVPGGPAEFNLWSSSLEERAVAEKTLRFLMEHHQLRAIWLIAHQDCAYYRAKLQPLDAGYILRRQIHDLAQTAEAIRREYPSVAIQLVYAALEQNRVSFIRLKAPNKAG
jgi:hypothetical protein